MEIKSNNHEVRRSNRKRIINTLFRFGPITARELTKRLDLSHVTVLSIIKELVERGLVERGEVLESSGGRPPVALKIVFDTKCAIGISIASNHVRIVHVNMAIEVVSREKYEMDLDGTAEYWEAVSSRLEDFIERHGIDEDSILGVGISIQAPIENKDGVILVADNAAFGTWNLDLIKQAFKRPVDIDNDGKTASFAQVWGAECPDNVVFLLVGAGVGGAVIMDRRVWNSGERNAEFGHMIIKEGGRPCACGQRGCLGSYCSTRRIREYTGVGLEEFFRRLSEGERTFCQVWDEYMRYLAVGIKNIRGIFGMDIILGGEVSHYLKPYADDLRRRLEELSSFGEGGDYLRIGEYGEYDAAVGSALLHIDAFIND